MDVFVKVDLVAAKLTFRSSFVVWFKWACVSFFHSFTCLSDCFGLRCADPDSAVHPCISHLQEKTGQVDRSVHFESVVHICTDKSSNVVLLDGSSNYRAKTLVNMHSNLERICCLFALPYRPFYRQLHQKPKSETYTWWRRSKTILVEIKNINKIKPMQTAVNWQKCSETILFFESHEYIEEKKSWV